MSCLTGTIRESVYQHTALGFIQPVVGGHMFLKLPVLGDEIGVRIWKAKVLTVIGELFNSERNVYRSAIIFSIHLL